MFLSINLKVKRYLLLNVETHKQNYIIQLKEWNLEYIL